VAYAPVLAAIGAVGHPLVECKPEDRAALKDKLLDQLRLVRRDKGKSWEGIAGKFTPKNNFSVGGTKETAYQVYAALNDRTSAAYEKVRVKSLRGGVAGAAADERGLARDGSASLSFGASGEIRAVGRTSLES